jgi:hypothetical protein
MTDRACAIGGSFSVFRRWKSCHAETPLYSTPGNDFLGFLLRSLVTVVHPIYYKCQVMYCYDHPAFSLAKAPGHIGI